MSFVYAWTAPTVAAPNGNVAAPINTSATAQVKAGGLTVGNLKIPYSGGILTLAANSLATNGLSLDIISDSFNSWAGINFKDKSNVGLGGIAVSGTGTGLTNPDSSYRLFAYADGHTYHPTGAVFGHDGGNTKIGRSILAIGNIESAYGSVASKLDMLANGITVGMGMNSIASSTAVGYQALFNNGGIANTAVGYQALMSNIAGSVNTASGVGALKWNTSGLGNTATGAYSLFSNETGHNNTAYGVFAGGNNMSGSSNVAIGALADYDTYSLYNKNNTVIGFNAQSKADSTLYGIKSGPFLDGILPSANNVVIGANATYDLFAGYALNANYRGNSVVIGANSFAGGESSVVVGEHAISPFMPNSVVIGAGARNGVYAVNNISGNTGTTEGIAIGRLASITVPSGSLGSLGAYQNPSIAIGGHASVSEGNSIAIGAGVAVTTANTVQIGNSSIATIGGAVNWSTPSDLRLKEDVADYTHGLDFITKLRPVTFKMKADDKHTVREGFIAQEVEATGVPFYGINKPENKDSYYSLSYADFVVPLVNSVKELKAENDKLRAENDLLHKEIKANNDALIARIEKLELRK